MADVNIQKRPSGQERQGSHSLEHQRYDPFGYRGGFFSSPWDSPFGLLSTSPFGLMRRLRDDMDQFFGNAWSGSRERETGAWWPAVEVSEQAGKLTVHADLPGVDKNDVKVELTDGNLIIQGERKREHQEESGGFRRSERSYGTFYRSIPLPDGANTEGARAQFKDGVLEVTVPVPESQRKRTIPIETETGERKQVGGEATSSARQSKTS
jgi:HSP20 family protein